MRLLADTHVYLWWLSDDPRLNSSAREAIADPASTIFVSAASIWEISIKVSLGRLDFAADPLEEIPANGFHPLSITPQHAQQAGRLPRHHDDPFDRMLIAQAQLENLVLLSRDAVFPAYKVQLLPA